MKIEKRMKYITKITTEPIYQEENFQSILPLKSLRQNLYPNLHRSKVWWKKYDYSQLSHSNKSISFVTVH